MLNKLKSTLSREEGFTLVELMVVVAIIGILAAVAIPNYQKYQARARQSEARVMLSSSYTAEQSYFAEAGTYSLCLKNIGFDTSSGAKRYYTVGFSQGTNGSCGPANTSDCKSWAFNNTGVVTQSCLASNGAIQFVATAGLGGTATGDADLSITAISQTAFTIGAAGRISSQSTAGAGVADYWDIDQSKNLQNVTVGI